MLDISQLINRRLLFVTGKGGVGKTTVAVALAVVAASLGKRTLLVECASQEQITPLLGRAPTGHSETRISPNLSTINLSTQENFREYITKYLGQKLLYDKVFSNKVMQSFINTIPGLAEVMLLGRLYYTLNLANGPKPDLMIFDSSASGHFMSLMTTPDSVLSTGLGGPMIKEVQNVRNFIADEEKCGTVYVTIPEELVISECIDFLPKLIRNSPSKLLGLIVNKVVPTLEEPTIGQSQETEAATNFALFRQKKRDLSIDTLTKYLTHLEQSERKISKACLPDLGIINEPISEDSSKLLLNEIMHDER